MSTTLKLPQLLIIEFGGQLTLKIESGLREVGYRAAILDPKRAVKWANKFPVKGVILSGGLASVYDPDAPKIPEVIFALGVPVLGICYGMQAIASHFHGVVEKVTPQYGRAVIRRFDSTLLVETPTEQPVWSSHGDSVITLPEGFRTIAQYIDTGKIAAIADEQRNIWGVQFHPEAEHTPHGKAILQKFAEMCNCEKDWRPGSMAEEIAERALEYLGPDEAIIGFSGGVDSTTVATILGRKLRERLHSVAVDTGALRENELSEVRFNAKAAGVELVVVDASDRFLGALEGVADAQEKRKGRFQPMYATVFQETARAIGTKVKWFVQGTLAPDRIESGGTGAAVIKTHHNVGLDMGGLGELHPLGHLFKYEIRALARELGLPKSVSERQPFPGPGLFIRHIGPITRAGIETVRWSTARVTEVLVRLDIYDILSQLVVAYFTQKLVGIKGDERSYQGFAGVRAVQTIDFMTAEGFAWPPEVQKELCRILGRHPNIVHVAFFPMDKPPATTEFE